MTLADIEQFFEQSFGVKSGIYPFAYLAWRVGLVPAEFLWHFQASIGQKDMYCATDNLLMFGYLVAKKPLLHG